MMSYKIYIGTEPSQFIAQRVLEYSIRKYSENKNLKIEFITQAEKRVGGTNFGFARFSVPERSNFEGLSLYLDADQIVFDDISKLFNLLPTKKSIGVVVEPEGYFNKKRKLEGIQTSVMILNNKYLKNWKTKSIFTNVVKNGDVKKKNEIYYKDFMKLKWVENKNIQPLPPEWNHFNIINKKTKLVHFSHVRTQPWKMPSHPLAKVWTKFLREAIDAKFIQKKDIFFEIIKGHINIKFIRYVFFK